MAITKWNPFNMQFYPSKFFDDEDFDISSLWEQKSGAMDMYEEGDNIVVTMKTPGFDKDNIDVNVTNDVLTIKAEKREEENEKRKYYRKETKSIETIARSVTLPSSVKSDSVKASLKNGVLKLVFVKKEEAKPKTIKITDEG
ncbi:Hsp20/alpha crystallin family protein [Patescibacteria group bacterium]|nr:Hsp20/alpha crystallin family protein [Patescibacteria group bacterium]